jgi:aspartate racemase
LEEVSPSRGTLLFYSGVAEKGMPKHIGIVACSAEGAALCYRAICDEAQPLMGRHMHPEITMHTHCLGEYMDFIYRYEWQGVAGLMLSSANKLAEAGADFLISPDNTIHHAFDLVAPRSPLPWLHIVDEVAAIAESCRYCKLAITGTKYTMEGSVYPEKLSALGIEYLVPEAEERAGIDRIIMNELVNGIFTTESRTYFQQLIARMKGEGCDAVVLGCTEIPLLVDDSTSPLPTLDSTRILARAALRHAMA